MTAEVEQPGLFDDPLDHLCRIYFDAWSDDWDTVKGVHWDDLGEERPKNHVRAGIRAVLAELGRTP